MTRICRAAIVRSPFGDCRVAPLLIGITLLHGLAIGAYAQDEPLKTRTPRNVEDLTKLETEVKNVLRVRNVLRNVSQAIVAVGKSGGGFASGVIIRGDGLILSQYHVSHEGKYDDQIGLVTHRKPGERTDVILHDGRTMEAELLGGHRQADLSLLRIVEPGIYPFVPLADENSVSLGEWVLKLGHPLGYDKSRGMVSRLGRVLYHNRVTVVADCMTTGGDSGGPLVNLDGKVVGIIQDSGIPDYVSRAASAGRINFLMSYSTVGKIQEKMPAMMDGQVPRETTFVEHEQRRKLMEEIDAMLPGKSWKQGEETIAAWRETTAAFQGSVVEVFDGDLRVAYGTVVGANGWVLTKASEIGDEPRCRVPHGKIVSAKIAGVDAAYDLAMLKIEAQGLRPIQWASEESPSGTFVATADRMGKPIASGIVSAPTYRGEGPFPTAVVKAFRQSDPTVPEMRGKTAEGDGFEVSLSVGSAAKADIRAGDVVLEIDGKPIQTERDILNLMPGRSAGNRLSVVLMRGGRRVETRLTLRGRGVSRPSFRSKNFPSAFEHDIPLFPEECGGPVIGVDGKALGITIARADSHACIAIPHDAIEPLIERLKANASAKSP